MNRQDVAVKVLKCFMTWEPGTRVVGNIRAVELAALAAMSIETCPKCGSTAWVNIDCDLCSVSVDVITRALELGICEGATASGKPCAAVAGHFGDCVPSLALCPHCNEEFAHEGACTP